MSTPESNLRLRPRFRDFTPISREEVKQRITRVLSEKKESWIGEVVDNHVIVKIPRQQQHYWSPQLTLELEDKDSGTLIRGLFGPKPGVWTMFVFFYSAIGFLTLMGLIFGLSQMTLNMEATGLWSVPVGAFLLIGLFVTSKIGQRLGKEQMHQLHSILHDSLRT